MKTNTLSAFVLASFACLSAACTNTSPSDDLTSDELVLDTPSDSNDSANAHNKALSYNDKIVIPSSELPFGASYEEWAAAYWQWALAIPAEKSPLLDGPCEQNQSGSVFFLAGTMGGGHHRSCQIPRGKGIFIPVMNTVARSCPEMADDAQVCQDLASFDAISSLAQRTIDTANPRLRLTVDGKEIQILDEYRVQSAAFTDTSPQNPDDRLFATCSGPIETNLCGIAEGQPRPAMTDGYFVMLRQLSDGPHQIQIAASVSPDSTEPPFEVTYDIFVTWTQQSGAAY